MKSAEVARYRLGINVASIPPARRGIDEAPLTVEQFSNAARRAEYAARVNGVKEPRLRLWRA